MLIDDKDQAILFELIQDCRQPTTKIAKKTKLPEKTVAYRIQSLEKRGVIKKYTANIDYQKIGYNRHSIYLDLKPIDPELVDKYIKTITNVDEVSCCYMLHEISQWKVYLSVWTKNIARYDEIQGLILKKFSDYVIDHVSFQSVRSYTYFSRILDTSKVAKCDVKDANENINITELDKKIINELRVNGRKPLIKISQNIGTSMDTVKRRVKFLKEKEIIKRFYPIIDVKKAGLREYTVISRIKAGHEKEMDDFITWARSDPRFVIIIKSVGWVNLYYAFQVKNDDEYREISKEIDKRMGKITIKSFPIEVESILS